MQHHALSPCLPAAFLLLLLNQFSFSNSSPAIIPWAQDHKHSLQFGNPVSLTISASLSLTAPTSQRPRLSQPSAPSSSGSLRFSSSSPYPSTTSSNGEKTGSTSSSSIGTSGPHSPSGPSGNEEDSATSVLWIPHATDPHITHNPKSTWIQDDYPPQPPTNTSSPLLQTSLPGGGNITCRNFPSKQSLVICDIKLMFFLFLIFYIIILRTVLYLQAVSARQVLDLGEVLARCRDSYKGYAWEALGSWKIRQQPELPGVAMLTIQDMETIASEEGSRAGWLGGFGGRGYGTMRDGGLARPEIIYLEDLDYRRKRRKVGNTTPEEIESVKGKTRLTRAQEDLREVGVNVLLSSSTTDEGEESPGEQVTGEEERERSPKKTGTFTPTPEQRRALEEKRQEMVRKTHVRMLNDTKSKRVVYGAFVVFWSVGLAFLVLGSLLTVVCKQIWKMGRCPFEEGGKF